MSVSHAGQWHDVDGDAVPVRHFGIVLPMAEVMSLKQPAYFINHLPEFDGR